MSDLFSLTGQTAVITGAARGIGQAMAIGLAEAGADIILILVRKTLDLQRGQRAALTRPAPKERVIR